MYVGFCSKAQVELTWISVMSENVDHLDKCLEKTCQTLYFLVNAAWNKKKLKIISFHLFLYEWE